MPVQVVRGPEDRTVKAGDRASFSVDAPGAEAWQWRRNGQAIVGATQPSLVTDPVTTTDDGSRYSVEVSSGADRVTSPEALLKVETPEPALIWDATFALRAAAGLVALLALLLLPLWLVAKSLLDDEETQFAGLVAIQCVIVGSALAAAGVYLALLELRGRARTAEQLMVQADAGAPAGQSFGPVADAIKETPAALKAFGELRASAALLLLAAILFVAAAALGWRSLPDPSAAAPAHTASPTATASPTPARGR